MSKFEKIIVSLIDENIKAIDLTSTAGFIDSFTNDPDKPTSEKEFFLVYDDRVRNDYSKDRAIRFSKSTKIKRTYIKYVNSIPYLVYSFWVNKDIQKHYSGVISLSTKEKIKLLQFWSPFDSIVDTVMSNSCLTTKVTHNIPLSDFNGDLDICGFNIQKKGQSRNEIAPFIFKVKIE